jgi:hypothetical protein
MERGVPRRARMMSTRRLREWRTVLPANVCGKTKDVT